MIEDIAANLIWRTAIKVMIICLFKVYYMWFYLVFGRWPLEMELHEYRNNPTPYKLKDPLRFLQLPCFYIWPRTKLPWDTLIKLDVVILLEFFLGHTKSVKDLYFAPTWSALPLSSILKIISVGKCGLWEILIPYLWA